MQLAHTFVNGLLDPGRTTLVADAVKKQTRRARTNIKTLKTKTK
jgi:hypothetical protein